MADLDGFVSDLIRQKGLSNEARATLLDEVRSRMDDMVLDKLESETALDEYNFLYDSGDEKQLREFLVAAIPDLETLENQVLDDFRRSCTA